MQKTISFKVFFLLLLSMTAIAAAGNFDSDVRNAIARFKKKDQSMSKFFDEAFGYAVFPNVGKGGLVIGGAHGNGLVFEKGKRIGKASLVQATIGFQMGGQEFSEIIFFRTKKVLDEFKAGKFALAAEVSAVAAAEGAAAKAKYNLDIAVFVMPKGGLMFEASVGGQKFDFEP